MVLTWWLRSGVFNIVELYILVSAINDVDGTLMGAVMGI